MIYVMPDIFRAELNREHEFSGALIDFLQSEFPTGFGSEKSAVFVNGDIIAVADYDIAIESYDTVVILPRIPMGADPISWTMILIQIAISVALAAISMLFAPKPPKAAGTRGRVFDIGSGQNVPALGQVITEHFGQLWFYPDVASQPYVQYTNNEQYVFQLLLLGAGEYRLDNIKFGNTELKMIPAGLVDYRVYGPAQHKMEYGVIQSEFNIYEDVVTSVDVQGIDFARNANTSYIGKAYSDDRYLKGTTAVTGFSVGDSVTLLAKVSNSDNANHRHVTTITSISGNRMYLAQLLNDAGNPKYQAVKDDTGWRGWFSVCPVGKATNRIDLDFEFPSGIWSTNAEGDLFGMEVWINVELQEINDQNDPIGSVIKKQFYFQAVTRDPVRRTVSVSVPEGRYKVRAQRDNSDDVSSSSMSKIYWKGLKAYIVNPFGAYAYGDVTLIAIKMKASEALSSSSDKISVLATRILPTIESDFTVKAPTTNIVDAFSQVVREADLFGLDVDSLKILAQRWAATNGFNYRFSDASTVYDALTLIAYSHRATPTAYAKLISMRPDDEKPFDQFIVSSESMVRDSYNCGISIGSTVGEIDGMRVQYRDPTSTTDLYVVSPAGAVKPKDVSLSGCTDQATAVAHAEYLWAKTKTTKRVVNFETELDALAFSVGDRIAVLSNVVDSVRTCRLQSVNGLVLTVDAIMDNPEVFVKFRDQYGAPSDAIAASIIGNQLTVAELPPFALFGIDSGQEQTQIVIGSMASFRRSYVVNEISPNGKTVSVSASSYTPIPYLYPIPNEVLPP